MTEKEEHHGVLVTHGVYSFSRHPGYFGFFWWALGTQILLSNPVSLLLFSVVLWRFFNERISAEETYLIRFFGDDYVRPRLTLGVSTSSHSLTSLFKTSEDLSSSGAHQDSFHQMMIW